MKFKLFRRIVPSLAGLALFLTFGSLQRAHAVTLDWDALTWTPGAISQSYDIDPAIPGDDVTITFSGTSASITGDVEVNNSPLTGGLNPAQMGLEINLDFPANTDSITLTVIFSPSYVYGVENIL